MRNSGALALLASTFRGDSHATPTPCPVHAPSQVTRVSTVQLQLPFARSKPVDNSACFLGPHWHRTFMKLASLRTFLADLTTTCPVTAPICLNSFR